MLSLIFIRKEVLLTALFLLGIFLFSWNQIADFDFFYHLKTGQYIWQTKSVPLYDVFSYTAPGARWITHSWFFELILYGIYSLGGLAGVVGFAALLAAATCFLSILLGRMLGAPLPLLLLLLFPVSALSFELWVPRPQIFSYLFLVLLVFLLERFRRSGSRRALLGVLAVVLLWANMHASVVLGLALLTFYAGLELFKLYLPMLGIALPRVYARDLALATAAAWLISLLNPNGLDVLLYSRAIQPVVAALDIMEWRSIIDYLSIPQAQMFIALVATVNALVVWRLVFREETRDLGIAGAFLAVSILPLISIRHVGYPPLLGVPAAALALASFPRVKSFFARFSEARCSAVLFAAGIILAAGAVRLPRTSVNTHILSLGAVDFMAEHRVPGPLFNMANEGAYVMWRLWPRIGPFIDGRSEVYRGKPIADFLAIARQERDWERLFDEEYKINAALFWYRAPLDRWMGPFTLKLLQKKFALVYWDDAAILLLRDTPENAELIRSFGYRFINPFIPASRIRGAPEGVIAAEIQEALRRAPDSEVLRAYAAEFLAAQSQ